jgi:hypothetical protein
LHAILRAEGAWIALLKVALRDGRQFSRRQQSKRADEDSW